jgi:hypothetical protein
MNKAGSCTAASPEDGKKAGKGQPFSITVILRRHFCERQRQGFHFRKQRSKSPTKSAFLPERKMNNAGGAARNQPNRPKGGAITGAVGSAGGPLRVLPKQVLPKIKNHRQGIAGGFGGLS